MKEKLKKGFVNFIKEEYKSILLLIFVFLFFYIELPYKIYTPGGIVDLASRVKVENGYHTEGVIGMSYVSLVRGSIPYIILSKILPDWDLVPQEELKYDNETMEEKMAADKIATQESIDHAIFASYALAAPARRAGASLGAPVGPIRTHLQEVSRVEKSARCRRRCACRTDERPPV